MLERFLFRKIEVWVLGLVVVLMLAATVLFGSVTLHKSRGYKETGIVGEISVDIADIPIRGFRAVRELFVDSQVVPFSGPTGLVKTGKFADPGYLLLSAYDADRESSVVRLIRLRNGEVIHAWYPDPSEIMGRAPIQDRKYPPITLWHDFRSQAPLLLSDGSIIISSGEGQLARVGACGQTMWSIARHFHHSIELTNDGKILAAIVSRDAPGVPARDDGYAIVSLDGKILYETGLLKILTDNGLQHKAWDRPTNFDVFHVNDVEMMRQSDAWVRKGDILISSRHLSAVMLYRPSTGKIIWYKSGPWLAQHDVDYLGRGRFTVVGNDLALVDPPGDYFPNGHSSIWVFEPGTGAAQSVFDGFMSSKRLKTQGTHRFLRNGDLFLEDGDAGVLYRVDAKSGKEIWRYTQRAGSGVGVTHWSRYLYPDEIDLGWLKKTACKR